MLGLVQLGPFWFSGRLAELIPIRSRLLFWVSDSAATFFIDWIGRGRRRCTRGLFDTLFAVCLAFSCTFFTRKVIVSLPSRSLSSLLSLPPLVPLSPRLRLRRCLFLCLFLFRLLVLFLALALARPRPRLALALALAQAPAPLPNSHHPKRSPSLTRPQLSNRKPPLSPLRRRCHLSSASSWLSPHRRLHPRPGPRPQRRR